MMRFMVLGASGLVGSALIEALLAAGHSVVALCRRPPVRPVRPDLVWLAADIQQLSHDDWLVLLAEIDWLINAVGIFKASQQQQFAQLHYQAPAILFRAAVTAGLKGIIQFSALAASVSAETEYARTKAEADELLLALPLTALVLRPSLIYADNGPSSRVFRRWAAAPLLLVPEAAGWVQPIHRDDLVAVVMALLQQPPTTSMVVNLVGPRALPWADYLQALRQGMGFSAAAVLKLPACCVNLAVGLAAKVPNSLISRASLSLLRAGSCADSAVVSGLLGRALRDPAEFSQPALAAEAVWGLTRPLLVGSLAAVWLWTAWVSVAIPETGLALLAAMGLPPLWQQPALWVGAGLDLILGVLSLCRTSSRLWLAQAVLIGVYSLLISLWLPEWWWHPFGPLSKNLPILVVLLMLILSENRSATGVR